MVMVKNLYTNILTMLDLGGIPLRAEQRGEDDPLVVPFISSSASIRFTCLGFVKSAPYIGV